MMAMCILLYQYYGYTEPLNVFNVTAAKLTVISEQSPEYTDKRVLA